MDTSVVFLVIVSLLVFGSAQGQGNDCAQRPSVSAEVDISGQSYAVDKLPLKGSDIVLEQREELMGELNLDDLVDDLRSVGKLLQIAHLSVTASGPEHTDMKIKILKLNYEIVDLCEKTTDAIHRFKRVSKRAMYSIRDAYAHLLEGHSVMAVEMLNLLTDDAKRMEAEAKDLECLYDEMKETLHNLSIEIEKAKGKEEVTSNDVDSKLEEEERRAKQATYLFQVAEQEYLHFLASENEAIKELNDATIAEAVWEICFKFVGLGSYFNYSGERVQKVKHYKELKLEQLQFMQEYRQARYELNKNITDYIKRLRESSSISVVLVETLHHSVGSFQRLSVVMRKTAIFWKRLYQFTQDIASDRQASMIEMHAKDMRLVSIFQDRSFKERAVRNMARWVAFHYVCHDYMDEIGKTKQELYDYLKENPSYEAAKKKIMKLMKLVDDFDDDIVRKQEKLEAQERKAKEEMYSLEQDILEEKITKRFTPKKDIVKKSSSHSEL